MMNKTTVIEPPKEHMAYTLRHDDAFGPIIMTWQEKFSGVRVLCINTRSELVRGRGKYARCCSYIGFNDREGWKIAYRLARRLMTGEKVAMLYSLRNSKIVKVDIAPEHQLSWTAPLTGRPL